MPNSTSIRIGLAIALLMAGCVKPPTATTREGTIDPLRTASRGAMPAPAGKSPSSRPSFAPPTTLVPSTPPPTATPIADSTLPPSQVSPTPRPSPRLPRRTADQPDETKGYQVHFLYVLPADARDQQLDEDGTIDRAAAAMNEWFPTEADGHTLRIDTYRGRPDVTFFRMKATVAEVAASGMSAVRYVRRELAGAGFNAPNKVYASFYAGPTTKAGVGGQGGDGYAALYMEDSGHDHFRGKLEMVSYERAMLHEIVHAMGFVNQRAPHFDGAGHTKEDPTDLMQAGYNVGDPTVRLDPGHDDYYKHGRSDLPDLAKSLFLDPAPDGAVRPEGWPMATGPGTDAVRLPTPSALIGMTGDPTLEDAVLAAVNVRRAAKGLSSLKPDDALRAAARFGALETEQRAWTTAPTWAIKAGYWGRVTPAIEVIGQSLETSSIDALVDQMLANVPEALLNAKATNMAAGVVTVGGETVVVLLAGEAEFEFEDMTVGEGPGGTYTLHGRARVRPGRRFDTAYVYVGTKAYSHALAIDGDKWFLIVADVPKTANYFVGLLADTYDGKVHTEQVYFHIDGTKPLAQAVSEF